MLLEHQSLTEWQEYVLLLLEHQSLTAAAVLEHACGFGTQDNCMRVALEHRITACVWLGKKWLENAADLVVTVGPLLRKYCTVLVVSR